MKRGCTSRRTRPGCASVRCRWPPGAGTPIRALLQTLPWSGGMRSGRESRAVSDFKGRHFEGEIVLWAVRWYCRYGVSYRDLEQMMGERGVSVDHSTIFRWVQKYAPAIEKRLRWQWRLISELASIARAASMSSSVSFGGRPPVRPRRRAAARPAWVRSRIRLRSNSARAPNM